MGGDEIIQTYPWLESKLFYKITDTTDYANLINATRDDEILVYRDGWLVLKDKQACFLVNVHSLEKIKLPPVNTNSYTRCILTYSPRDSSCRVLFVVKDEVLYCRPGDKNYKTRNLQEGMQVDGDMVTVLEGRVYFIIRSDHHREDLGRIDFDGPGNGIQISRLQGLPIPNCPECSSFRRYLTESSGKLLLIFKAYLKFTQVVPQEEPAPTDVFCFIVFQFDFSNRRWVRLDSIGNSTIFLPRDTDQSMSHAISFCPIKPDQIKPNSIYFLQDDEYIHLHSLENKSFTLLPNGLNMVTSHIQEKSNGNLGCEEEDANFLPQFPPEISDLILARVFRNDPTALGVIRSVCRDWSRIVRPPTSNIDMKHNKYPYLVTLLDGTCNFFHPAYNHTFCLETPELLGAHIKFSRFGWLLLSRYISESSHYEYFFFNPFTKEKKNLPDGDTDEFATMSFSSPPTSSDCFVVGVGLYGSILASVKYGEENWSIFVHEPSAIFAFPSIRKRIVSFHPVFHKQKCYCLGANKELVIIDLNTRKMWVVGKIFSAESVEFRGCFLVEDEEGLLGIFLQTEKIIPHVMKMDLSQTKKLWKPVENLKDKMVYVSPAGSRSESAPTKSSAGNKIYFPMIWNSESVFYSLSSRKYHSFSGNYGGRDSPFVAQTWRNCAWIYVD